MQWTDEGIQLEVAGAIGPVRDALKRTGLMDRIGAHHFHTGVEAALDEDGTANGMQGIATQTGVKR